MKLMIIAIIISKLLANIRFGFCLAISSLVFLFSLYGFGAPQKIDGMYVNSYGDISKPALVFVHGGPGYDSQDFEISTAALLAEKGFYVVVYDQRGQGRSDLAQAQTDYTYKQYTDDLILIIKTLGLRKPILLGHSHGGPISLKFDQFYPGVASKIILISAPVNFFKSLDGIRINCSSRYSAIGDALDLEKLNSAFAVLAGEPSVQLEIGAVADIFRLGGNKPCDLYSPLEPTAEATALHAKIQKLRVPVAQENLFYPMSNFVNNEQYIHLDQSQWVKDNAEHIFGIYGSEDGLFTPDILADINADLAGNPKDYRFQLITGSSHAIYIDQRDKFLEAIIQVAK